MKEFEHWICWGSHGHSQSWGSVASWLGLELSCYCSSWWAAENEILRVAFFLCYCHLQFLPDVEPCNYPEQDQRGKSHHFFWTLLLLVDTDLVLDAECSSHSPTLLGDEEDWSWWGASSPDSCWQILSSWLGQEEAETRGWRVSLPVYSWCNSRLLPPPLSHSHSCPAVWDNVSHCFHLFSEKSKRSHHCVCWSSSQVDSHRPSSSSVWQSCLFSLLARTVSALTGLLRLRHESAAHSDLPATSPCHPTPRDPLRRPASLRVTMMSQSCVCPVTSGAQKYFVATASKLFECNCLRAGLGRCQKSHSIMTDSPHHNMGRQKVAILHKFLPRNKTQWSPLQQLVLKLKQILVLVQMIIIQYIRLTRSLQYSCSVSWWI